MVSCHWQRAWRVGWGLALVAFLFAGCVRTAPETPVPMPSTTREAVEQPTPSPLPMATLGVLPTPGPSPAGQAGGLPVPLPERVPTRRGRKVQLTVVYDNNPYDPRLRPAWGFSCLVQVGGRAILFDTGGDGALLLSNLDALNLDPRKIGMVVLSHVHGDHAGGLPALLALGLRPTVYLPRSFPQSFKAEVGARTQVWEVAGPAEVLPGVYTTGELGDGLQEQALAVDTPSGLVVITGCAHPGVVRLVRAAVEFTGQPPYLVMGGFHLGGASRRTVEGIIAEFQRMGVRKVAPCHCTGEQATRTFAEAFGEGFIACGVGLRLTLGEAGVEPAEENP